MKQIILEDIESKKLDKARKYIETNYKNIAYKTLQLPNGSQKEMNPAEWVKEIRNTIPASRLPKRTTDAGREKDTCMFLPGVTRLYFSLSNNQDQTVVQQNLQKLNQIIEIIASSHVNEYDEQLNNLSFNQLNQKFSNVITNNNQKIKNDVNNLDGLIKDDSYEIIKIRDFETARKYSKYTDWCVTQDESLYDDYTKGNLGVFYFCLKRGFENVKRVEGEGCPLDEYGKSMIAISVNEDGSLNTATCRWNHAKGADDHVFKNAVEVSKFFGVNFFETFKPRTIDEILKTYESNKIESKIADRLGGIETKDGELIVVENGHIKKYKMAYANAHVKCFAYDHFYWFDIHTSESIEPLKKVRSKFDCSECPSLTSLKGAPNEVNGTFECFGCTSLTSLEGAPTKVGNVFICVKCPSLTSLEGAPTEVGSDFFCDDCPSLTSLKGAPNEVNGIFGCSGCTSLTSLEGAPSKVNGTFSCSDCPSLTSLEYAPTEVGGSFSCTGCTSLTSLEGAPNKVNGQFSCISCTSLTSLEYAPTEVGDSFYCFNCPSLTSLEYAPTEVGRDFNCSRCLSLTSLEGAPTEVGSDFDCSRCTSLTSLKGAPRKTKLKHNSFDGTHIPKEEIEKYKEWLKTNPKTNYLMDEDSQMHESCLRFVQNIMQDDNVKALAILESILKDKVKNRLKTILKSNYI